MESIKMNANKKTVSPYNIVSGRIVKKYQNILRKIKSGKELAFDKQESEKLPVLTYKEVNNVFSKVDVDAINSDMDTTNDANELCVEKQSTNTADKIDNDGCIRNNCDTSIDASISDQGESDRNGVCKENNLIIDIESDSEDDDDDCVITGITHLSNSEDSTASTSSSNGDSFFFNLLKPIKTEKNNVSANEKKDDNESMVKELIDNNDIIIVDEEEEEQGNDDALKDLLADFEKEGDDVLTASTTNIKVDLGINNLYFCYDNGIFCIGEYNPKRGGNAHEIKRGSRYVELELPVVYELLKKLHIVDIDMEILRKKLITSKKYNLGGGWYLSLSHPWQCVHVRRWEARNNADYPSKPCEGFSFKFPEYVRFQEVAMQMNDFVEPLRTHIPCYERHNDQFSEIYCKQCNPFSVFIKTK